MKIIPALFEEVFDEVFDEDSGKMIGGQRLSAKPSEPFPDTATKIVFDGQNYIVHEQGDI